VKVVLATKNPHKVVEISAICAEMGMPLQIEAAPADLPETIEDGDTLEANAAKKAQEAAEFCGCAALADDTGLEIDALGGVPGHHAARWGGVEHDHRKNIAKALSELEDVTETERTARFRTVVALCPGPGEDCLFAEGRVEGRITQDERGEGGFGYDPIFMIVELGKTLAELDETEKNRLSHRFRALEALAGKLSGKSSR
jgi:XTP/dITP diphosphohydrolase